jgi:transcriptional regulator with XRE-family HTH domain
MDASWFGARLHELRQERGWTQLQLAERAGMTKNAIARLERGERSASWETVVALCKALGVSCDVFLQQPTTTYEVKLGRPRKPAAQSDQSGTDRQAKPSGRKPRRRGKK